MLSADQRRISLSLTAIGLALALPLVVAAQTDGLATTSVSTYTLIPDEGRIHADVTISLVNQRKARVDRWGSIWTPATAQEVSIGGPGVIAETVSDGIGYRDTLDFPPLGRHGKQKITASFDLAHDPLPGPTPTRVLADYAYFCWGGQDTGSGRVTAILPAGWLAVTAIEDVELVAAAERTTLRPLTETPPGDFYACTDAFLPSLESRIYTLGPSEQVITLDSWGNDPDWEPAMLEVVGRQLADLEQLIGVPMPIDALTVQEAFRSDPLGLDGDLHATDALLLLDQRVGVPGVAMVGFARTWFNPATIADPWLRQGLAIWSGLAADDQPCPIPPAARETALPDLSEWQVREGDPSGWHVDRYALQDAAACTIVAATAEALGAEAMTTVITNLLTGSAPADTAAWLATIASATADDTALELARGLLADYGLTPTDALGRAET